MKSLTKSEISQLLSTLSHRFEQHPQRHPQMAWPAVEARLLAAPTHLQTLQQMEATGGEPDVIGPWCDSTHCVFADCAEESPSGRRSLCFDEAALAARKENKPAGSALGMASAMGVTLLTAEQYRELQGLGAFDLKTSSWVATPAAMRKLGGALFCDRRFDTVFTYHNGVQSYYAGRGFRALLRV